MNQANPLNIFKGRDSMAQYFDPDLQPLLPLVELPTKLNPFRADDVRIYAKILTALPAQNVKALPALNMLLHHPTAATKSIVEASSGSTALSLGMISRVLWGKDDVCAHVTNKKHPDQLRMLRLFGLEVSLYGGLAQQEPVDPRGIMSRLRRLAEQDENVCYPGQYDNEHNWKAHVRWTGSQIWKQLPEINVFSTTVGTGGCVTGTGVYLKSQKPSVKVIGVCNVFGDPTPGPRHFPGFESCGFPWKSTIDVFETVASADSYRTSMQLSREGIIAGPSSGEALHGLLSYLQKAKDSGKLQELADPMTSEISCVFTCCDLPYQHLNGYFERLGEHEFPPIHNKILLSCDLDRYDERWVLSPKQTFRMLSGKMRAKSLCPLCNSQACLDKSSCTKSKPSKAGVLDLRRGDDFDAGHILGSRSSPLKNLTSKTGDIFGDPDALHMYWKNLRLKFSEETEWLCSEASSFLVLCYDGETSRLATSILRARGYEAYSVLDGFQALHWFIRGRSDVA